MTAPIARTLVSDQVFARLADAILSGAYTPGERLPTQRALAADLEVNMASVREAVKRLEQLRLVEVRHGDAMRVTDWRAQGGLDVIVHLLFAAGGLDRPTFLAVLETRRLMLAEAARLAAGRRTEAQARRLAELSERFAGEVDPGAAQLIDLEFMTTVVEAADNIVLSLILNTVRRLYLDHAHLFAALVADGADLAPLYRRAAAAVQRSAPTHAATALSRLAGEQERRLAEATR